MLHLVDSSIYVFRAWQTLPADIVNTFDEQANAIIGFTNTLVDIICKEKPSHLVCAFDESLRLGHRHTIYPDYKANRPPAPPELKIQFDRCKQVVEALGGVALGSQCVEADDIIGQLAALAHDNREPSTIITGDKDLAQFIKAGDTYWNYARNERSTPAMLKKRFGVGTHQIADLLALCGDKTDNIPGIPGVGMTTAARLLVKWGNLDTLFSHVDKVADMKFRGAPRISLLLKEHEQTVRLARELTGLIIDDTLPDSLSELCFSQRELDDISKDLVDCGFSHERAEQLATKTQSAYL
ncbi:MAG: flap endonuclease [Gammaproteobacteria bacterium]|nr:flap endonuclease [Gammaproteobacteria bacterium]